MTIMQQIGRAQNEIETRGASRDFVQLARCLMLSKGVLPTARTIAEQRGTSDRVEESEEQCRTFGLYQAFIHSMGRVARGPPSLELLLVLGEAVNLRSLRRNVAGLFLLVAKTRGASAFGP